MASTKVSTVKARHKELKARKIKVWRFGTMLRTVSKQQAIEMVKSGLWVVMTDQSIASVR